MKTIVTFDRHQLLLFADSDQLLHRQSCSRWRHSRHVLHSISGGNNTHQLSEYYGLQDIIINIIIRIVFNNHLTWDCQLCGVFMNILKITEYWNQNYGQIVQIFILGDNLSFFFVHVFFLFQFRAALVQRWDLPAFMCQFCPFAQILSVSFDLFAQKVNIYINLS